MESIIDKFNFSLGEIILVNDCSNTETNLYLKELNRKHKNLNLIENDTNLGFIKSCNSGMSRAVGDIYCLLNSDTEIPFDFAEKIIKCFELNTDAGIASPISSNSWIYHIPVKKGYNVDKMNILLNKKHKTKYPIIPSAEGFCFCIRRSVTEKIGFLDEVFGKGYHEEVDYSYRAIVNGWKNILIDNLYVFHKRHASFGIETREFLIKQNDKVFNERWSGFREKYIEEHNLKNPMEKIYWDLFSNDVLCKKLKQFFHISFIKKIIKKIISLQHE